MTHKKLIWIPVLMIFTILSVLTVSAETPPTGGISYYNFSDTVDYWDGNDGTNNGSTSVTDYPTYNISGDSGPNSFSFDDSNNEYVGLGDLGLSNSPRTLSAWVKKTTTNGDERIVSMEGNRFSILYGESSSSFEGKIYNGSTGHYVSSGETITDEWVHLVLTFNGSNMEFFLNGQSQGTKSVSDIEIYNWEDKIGNDVKGFTGRIDEVKIYDKGLSSTEVENLYNYGDINGDVPTGGISYYNFSVTDNLTHAIDSWDGNDGTMNNFDRNDGTPNGGVNINDGAMEFDGVDDWINITGSLTAYEDKFTVSGWIKIDEIDTDNLMFVYADGADSDYRDYIQIHTDGRMKVSSYQNGTAHFANSKNSLNEDEWYHFSLVRENEDYVELYLNGEKQADDGYIGPYDVSDKGLALGARGDNMRNFNGSIDDVQIHDKALTQTQIQEQYEEGRGNYAVEGDGLVAQYSGRDYAGTESSPTTIYDTNHLVDGKINEAITFDGVDDYVDAGNDSSLRFDDSKTFSIGAWFKFNDTDNGVLLGRDYSKSYYISMAETNLKFWTGGSDDVKYEGSAHSDNEWHYLLVTFDNGDSKLYLDNDLKSSRTGQPYSADTNPLYIGDSPVIDFPFNGSIDEVKIYDKSLNKTEIHNLYSYGTSRVKPIFVSNIDNPLDGEIFNTNTIGFKANSTFKDNLEYFDFSEEVFNTTYKVNTTQIEKDSDVSYSEIDKSESLSEGLHSFKVETTDGYNADSETITFEIDTTEPSITYVKDEYQVFESEYDITVSDDNLENLTIEDSCGFTDTETNISSPYTYLNTSNITSCDRGRNKQVNITSCDSVSNCNTVSYNYKAVGMINFTASDKVDGSSISDFTITVDGSQEFSTTNGFIEVTNLSQRNITINDPGFVKESKTFDFSNQTYKDYEFELYKRATLNFTFRNEKTEELIDNSTIDVEFISDTKTYNYSVSDGKLYVELLQPETYNIRYEADGYDGREYSLTVTNNTYEEITLYLLEEGNASELTVTVYKESDLSALEDAYVYLQRYYFDENAYKTVNVRETDAAGQVYFDVELEEEKYKFLVQKPFGDTQYVSSGMYIEATSLNLFVDMTEDIGKKFIDEQSIDYDTFYDNNTREFSVSFTDKENVASEFCLKVYTDGQFGSKLVNESCTESNDASLVASHPDKDESYYGKFTAVIDGKKQMIASIYPDTGDYKIDTDDFSLLMAALIVMFGALLSPISLIALLLSTTMLIFIKILGLIALSWGVIIIMAIGGFVVGIMLNMMRK